MNSRARETALLPQQFKLLSFFEPAYDDFYVESWLAHSRLLLATKSRELEVSLLSIDPTNTDF